MKKFKAVKLQYMDAEFALLFRQPYTGTETILVVD
jgi:hypothetical protein